MESIVLKTSDGAEKQIAKNCCAASKFLKEKIDSGKNEILIEDVKGIVLEKIIEYLEHYGKNTTFPKVPDILETSDLTKELDSWDASFVEKMSFEMAFNLINAGIQLEITHLHDICCAKIAAFMKGKTPEEVNKEFTIECQLTQEEAKELGLEGQ